MKNNTSSSKQPSISEVNAYADNFARQVSIDCSHRKAAPVHPLLLLEERPLKASDDPVNNDGCRVSVTYWFIKYKPFAASHPKSKESRTTRNRPFYVQSDALEGTGGRFSDWEDLCTRDDPWCQWLVKYSTLTKGMFDIAKKNPNAAFIFGVKWEELAKDHGSDLFIKTVDMED